MATYTPQSITPSGVTPTYNAAASGGDKVSAGANERDYIHIKNGGGSSITATVSPAVATVYQEGLGNVTVPSIALSVAASGEGVLGPFPASYIQADGTINIAWSDVTSVTFAALRLDPVSKSFN